MKLGIYLAFAASVLVLAGCGKPGGGYRPEVAMESESVAQSPMKGGDSGTTATNPVSQRLDARPRSVIRKAEVSVRVEKLGEAEKQLSKLVGTVGGYVSGSASDNLSDVNPTSVFTIRVPATKFDEVMDKIEALGTPTRRSITTDDVTGQMVDLEARMRALRAQEQAILGLFNQAHSLKDTLAVRDQLTQVRTEIEEMQGMHQELSNLAKMSTITVTLNQSAVTSANSDDPNWAKEAWGSSTASATKSMREIAKFGITLVVCAPIWVPFVLIMWWGLRKLIIAGTKPPAPSAQ